MCTDARIPEQQIIISSSFQTDVRVRELQSLLRVAGQVNVHRARIPEQQIIISSSLQTGVRELQSLLRVARQVKVQ